MCVALSETVSTFGRSCINEYCSAHRVKLKSGSVPAVPRRRRGVGVQTESRLCTAYGSDQIQHRLVYMVKQASET